MRSKRNSHAGVASQKMRSQASFIHSAMYQTQKSQVTTPQVNTTAQSEHQNGPRRDPQRAPQQKRTKKRGLNLDVDKLTLISEKTTDANLRNQIKEVKKMQELQDVSFDQLFSWSLSHSNYMRRFRQLQREDAFVQRQLAKECNSYKQVSHQRNPFFLTRAGLEQRELNRQMRNHILAIDTDKIKLKEELTGGPLASELHIKFNQYGQK